MANPTREEVLSFIATHGPTIPVKIKQALGGDNLFIIGAILSDLISQGKVKVTHLKFGGTPFYYVPGQEPKLVSLREHLNPKDQDTFDLLRKEKVLRDKELSPLLRVSLRNLKDFAFPLEVQINGQRELFWKWFLLSNKEAAEIIKEKYLGQKKVEEEKKKVEEKSNVKENLSSVKQSPSLTKKERLEEPKVVKEEKERPLSQFVEKPNPLFNELKNLSSNHKEKLQEFFQTYNIELHNVTSISKTSFEGVVFLQTPLTKIRFYLVAKFKKKCNLNDIKSAVEKSQALGLPLIFLTTGTFSKSAEPLILKIADKNIILRRL